MSGWFSGGLAAAAGEAALYQAKALVLDGLLGGSAAAYGYYCAPWVDISLGWKWQFALTGGVQACAVPVTRYLKLLAMLSEQATTTLRYVYLFLFVWSIHIAAVMGGLIGEVLEWQEETREIVDDIKQITNECNDYDNLPGGKSQANEMRRICFQKIIGGSFEERNQFLGTSMLIFIILILGHLMVAYLSFNMANEYAATEKNEEDEYGDYYNDSD